VHDRIDWVLAAGPATAVASDVVGERGGPDVDIPIDPYPTDHRGVASTFVVEPGEPSPFAAPERRRLKIGDNLQVAFHAPAAGSRVAIARVGRGPLVELPTLAEDGTRAFATAGLRRGAYEVLLLDSGGTVLSRAGFWLYRPGERTRVKTSRHAYRPGQPIEVSWSNGPGMRWDWLAVFRVRPGSKTPYSTPGCNATTCGNGAYLVYDYTKTAIAGSLTLSQASGGSWPLRPGRYEVRYLLDDGYHSVAKSARFTILDR
jgi:hypothetical protein